MYRELDMTGPGVWRRALVAVGVIGAVVVLAGCSHGPDPKAQRDGMVAATTAVIKTVTDLTAMPEPAVLDDAAKPIDCPGSGHRYQYIAYGVTDKFANEGGADARLDAVTTLVSGASMRVPGGREYFTRSQEVLLVENGDGPRQLVYFVDKGSEAGVILTVDYMSSKDGQVLVRFAGATACE